MGITAMQLQNVIELYPVEQMGKKAVPLSKPSLHKKLKSRTLDVPTYLAKYGIECVGEKQYGDSTLHLLAECIFDSSHSEKEAAIGQTLDGKLFYQCFHDSCKDHKWSEARQRISGDDKLFDGHTQQIQPDEEGRDNPDSPLTLVKSNEESQPFPFDALGTTMAAACVMIQSAVKAPDGIIAQSVLGAVNLAIQGLANVIIDGRVFPLSLFLLSIAGTGERKSAVDSVALAKHREIEKENISKLASEQGVYEINSATYEHEKNILIKDKKKSLEEKQIHIKQLQAQQPIEPLDQTILVTDFTFEGLFKLFQIGVPGKGLFADEGGQVTGGHGMKSESILATAAGLSKFWDGSRVDRIRVVDGSSHLYGRRLSVHLMMQENVGLGFYTNDILTDQGLISRFLVVWPTSTVGSRTYSSVSVKDTDPLISFYYKIGEVMGKNLQYKEDSNNQELDPPLLPLSPEAKQKWEQCYNSIEIQSAKKQPLAPIRGLANKAAEHAARIAGTIQLFEEPGSTEIKAEAMQCGITAIEWYLDEALRIAGSFSPESYLLRAKEVLRWIHDNKLEVVPLPDIYQFSPVRSALQARKVVEVLIAHNHLLGPFRSPEGEPRNSIETKSGKTSREWWCVHPESNRRFCDE